MPVATAGGQTATCLPSCHCTTKPLTVSAPYLMAWVNGASLPKNWTRPIVPT